MAIQSRSIDKVLSFKNKISAETTAATITEGAMPDTAASLPVYDENGNILGYIALYGNADLT